MTSADVVVAGLGAMGSAALLQLAARGVRAVGVDRFTPPHALGSSTGETRITRLAIHEGAQYVAFARRSQWLWRELEAETGADLLTQCGGLLMNRPGLLRQHHGERTGDFVHRTVDAARLHGVDHELLDTAAIRERFPQFTLAGDEYGYLEPEAGFVRPERCIETQLEAARRRGAEVRLGEQVQRITQDGDHVEVVTDRDSYVAARAIVSAGAWVPRLLPPPYRDLFTVRRLVLHWFEITGDAERLAPEHMPVYIWDFADDRGLYGFPAVGGRDGGVKIGIETPTPRVDPDHIHRDVAGDEVAQAWQVVAGRFADLGPRAVRSMVCMYTETPDGDFVVDHHPEMERVLVVSACSGHGFKHSAALGETAAQLVVDGAATLDVAPFSWDRLTATAAGAR